MTKKFEVQSRPSPPGGRNVLSGFRFRCRLTGETSWSLQGVSRQILRQWGLTPAAQPVYQDLVHPEDLEAVLEQVKEALGKGRDFHLLHRLPGCRERWVIQTGMPLLPDGRAFEGFLTSLDQPAAWRRRLQEELRYLKEAGILIVVLDREGRVGFLNQAACRTLGTQREEVMGKDWFAHFVPAASRRQARAVFRELLSGRRSEEHADETPLLCTGGKKTFLWRYRLLRDEAGEIEGVICSGEEITTLKKAQEELRQSEARLRAVLDTAVDGIITIDARGTIQSFNPGACQIFGYQPREVVGKNVSILMPPPDRAAHDDYIRRYLETGEARIIGIGREVTGLRKDGTLFPLYLAVGEYRQGEERMFTGIVRDLTELKRMQERLIQQERLAALGEMAASIAHQVRNPLAGISGAIQVLQEDVAEADPRRRIMEEILRQVQRLDQTVQDLLTLAKPLSPELQLLSLDQLLRRLVAAARRQEDFQQVDFRLEPCQPIQARVDPFLLEQVLWNLFQNSVQAMGKRGLIRLHLLQNKEFVELEVADRGPGIPESMLDNLFRPFQTTKHRGTGLGLVICKKIMEAHGGKIEIESRAGEGTSVRLLFPRSAAQQAQ